MTRLVQIQTTIPARTLGKSKRSVAPHSLYMRVSFLELERERHLQEIANCNDRSARLQARLVTIEAEQSQLLALLQASSRRADDSTMMQQPAATGALEFRY